MAASRAFLDTWNERALVPQESADWDTYAARLFRYHHNAAYYNSTIYSTLSRYAATQKAREGLYRHIRSIYNPVARQNDLLVSYVYGGGLDLESLTGGAIPIVCDDEALLDAIRQAFIWSRWGESKSLYVRWGAQFGDVALKVVDDRAKAKVRLEVLHPGKLRDMECDAVGNVKRAVIEYERSDAQPYTPTRSGGGVTASAKSYTYSEVWEAKQPDGSQWVRTYKDGEPFPFYEDEDGKPVAAWQNEYGFVPIVLAQHKETGLGWGASSFHHCLRKIDEVNDYASLLNDQIRKTVNALWYFAGVQSKDELKASAEKRDETPAIYGPKDSQPHAMIADLPIDAALNGLASMLQELERDMPELALQNIRDKGGSLTAPGVRAGYSDAIGRIEEARGNYDHALVRALQMAVSIGGFNRYENFEPFTLDSYARGDLDFSIKERPVIDDTLTKTERLTALTTVGTQPAPVQRLILKELNYSDNEIDAVTTAAEAATQAQTRAAVRGVMDSIVAARGTNGGKANETPAETQPAGTGNGAGGD